MTAAALPDRRAAGRPRVIVLYGGQSAEHEISCISAREVLARLDPERYDIVAVSIHRDGRWSTPSGAVELVAAGRADELPPALAVGGDAVEATALLRVDDVQPTVVFPVLHGPFGEDGTVQGLLELANVPYVSSGVLGSALAMDKAAAKTMIAAAGIPQARWRTCTAWEWSEAVLADIVADLGLPLFVKPANMGSSVGVSKVSSADELADAVGMALRYDERLVFEEAVNGREIEVAMLGTTAPRASLPGEIITGADAAFYDYEDKYLNGAARWDIPAKLSDAQIAEVQDLAVAAFGALRGEILGRCDFFFEEHGRGWLFNELNTLPGCTPLSMFPMMWEASGLPYPALLDELITTAIERHVRRASFR